MVEAYFTVIPENVSDEQLNILARNLDEKHYAIFSTLHNREEKVQMSVSDYLTRKFIAKRYKMHPREVNFKYNKNGVPFVVVRDEFYFSNAIKGKFVALAYSNNYIGIDIKEIKNVDEEQVQKVLSEEELQKYNKLENHTEKNSYFTRIWTAKESYFKTTGFSSGEDMRPFTVVIERSKIYLKRKGEMLPNVYIREFQIDNNYSLFVTSFKVSDINHIQIVQFDSFFF